MTANLMRSVVKLIVTSAMIVLTLSRIASALLGRRRNMRPNVQHGVRPHVEITCFKPQINVNFGSRAGDKDTE
ncbi:MAG: hypothetical protein ACXVI3_00245 [Halobacteriota archaeon]